MPQISPSVAVNADLTALVTARAEAVATELALINGVYAALRESGASLPPNTRLLAECERLSSIAAGTDSCDSAVDEAARGLSEEIIAQLRPALRKDIPRVAGAVHEYLTSMGGANDAPLLGATLAMLGVRLPDRIDQRIALVEAACSSLAEDPASMIVRGAPHWLAGPDEQYPLYGHRDFMARST
ncbi:hypothetical protein ACWIGI_34645 [Nocardia sp. NPDC055321]